MHSFHLAAAPRSGTMAMARLLDQSPSWVVTHQMDSHARLLGQLDPGLFDRFRGTPYYGEVGAHLLDVAHVLPAERKGVVLRDPRDCLISAYNYKHAVPNADYGLFDRAELTFALLDFLAEQLDKAGCVFFYRDVFGSALGFRSMAEKLGVGDLPEDLDVSQRHNEHQKVITQWSEVPAAMRQPAEGATDWFRAKWFG